MTFNAAFRKLFKVQAAIYGAAAALLFASTAEAAVVFTDTADLTISAGSLIAIDFGTGGAGGSASITSNPPSGSDLVLSYLDTLSNKPLATAIFGRVGVAAGASINFILGSEVGPNMPMSAFMEIYSSSMENPTWPPGTSGYIGVMFNTNGDTPLYGWANISYNSDHTLTIYNFAYESSGASIAAGATITSIPEPSATVALVSLLVSACVVVNKTSQSLTRQSRKPAA